MNSSGDKYTISGYAYGGGGIALTRVEVTLDDGKVRREEGGLFVYEGYTRLD